MRNPLDAVEPPNVARKEMRILSVEQARAFVAAAEAEGPKWRAFFHVWITTGMRPSELRGLRWTDLDLEGGSLQLQQTIMRVNGFGRVTKPPKSAAGRRRIDLYGDVVAGLRRHKAAQNEERLALGPLWKDHGLVFPSQVGTPLEDKRIREVFFRICDRAGVPRVRPYDLRHSAASLMLALGYSAKIVAERLGHSNVSLTLSTSSHVLPGLQREAANALGQLLWQAP